ncbi:hypothetical protein SGPA1_50808 [Streptomyces misionensis JCM 4497]
MRPDPAVHGPGEAPEAVRRTRFHRARRAVQPVPRAGARHGRGDRRVLLGDVRRDLPAHREGGGERRGPAPAVPAPRRLRGRRGPQRGHPLELREVPDRPGRRGRRPVLAADRAGVGGGRRRDRGAARLTAAP